MSAHTVNTWCCPGTLKTAASGQWPGPGPTLPGCATCRTGWPSTGAGGGWPTGSRSYRSSSSTRWAAPRFRVLLLSRQRRHPPTSTPTPILTTMTMTMTMMVMAAATTTTTTAAAAAAAAAAARLESMAHHQQSDHACNNRKQQLQLPSPQGAQQVGAGSNRLVTWRRSLLR